MRIPGYNLNHKSPLLPFRLLGMNPLEYLSILQGEYSRLNGFDVASLFKNGEQGFWYDTNDLTTLFQDAAGTTPVTAAGQPVGLQLDKSGNGNHRFQTVAASRPMLRLNATTGFHYLETDGSEDWMRTNAIDFTSTDKVSLFTGVRKLSAATSVIVEMSTSSSTNGIFSIFSGLAVAADYSAVMRITAGSGKSARTYTAPASNVITATFDSSQVGFANEVGVRIDGLLPSSTGVVGGTESGVGNFGNHAAYFFRRAGTSLPFNGHEYGSICVGRLCTIAEVNSIEKLLAERVGVSLA